MDRLDGFTLPQSHPMAGADAYQCPVCHGISYSAGGPCPYCEDEEGDD